MQCKEAEEVAPALSAFADVVLIAGARNAQRVFFPLCFLVFVLASAEQLKVCGFKGSNVSMNPSEVDFSGRGMWRIYKACSKIAWKLETAMDDISAGQVVYHSIFETQNEDLGVLQTVTDMKTPWKLRSELADKFRSTGKTSKVIRLPQQRLYSKMAQANMTGLLTESDFQIRCKQVFAGKEL